MFRYRRSPANIDLNDDPYAPARPRDYALFLDHEEQPVLSVDTRIHLWHCSAMLYDEVQTIMSEAAREVRLPWEGDDSAVLGFSDYLPRSQLRHCDWQTARDFTHAVEAVISKLGKAPLHQGMLSNTMEEFAMRALIERSKFEVDVVRDLVSEGFEPGYDPSNIEDIDELRELAFQDADHELLFMQGMDGIEDDTETGRLLGLPDLRPRSWLTPFGSAPDKGHPLSWTDPAASD